MSFSLMYFLNLFQPKEIYLEVGRSMLVYRPGGGYCLEVSPVFQSGRLFFSAGFGNTDSILRTEQGVPGSLERGLPGQER